MQRITSVDPDAVAWMRVHAPTSLSLQDYDLSSDHRCDLAIRCLESGQLGLAMHLYDTAPQRLTMANHEGLLQAVFRVSERNPATEQSVCAAKETDTWVLDALQWLNSFHQKFRDFVPAFFSDACRHGYLDTMQWMHEQFHRMIAWHLEWDKDELPWNQLLADTVRCHQFDAALWLMQRYPDHATFVCNHSMSEFGLFYTACCKDGNVNLALRLLALVTPLRLDKVLNTICLPTAVQSGQVWMAKILYWKHRDQSWHEFARRAPQILRGTINCSEDMKAWVQETFQLPIAVAVKVDWPEECPICYDALVEVNTECGHAFCRPCILRHLDRGSTACPMCRCPIYTNSLVDLCLR